MDNKHITIVKRDIASWTSQREDRIILPYRLTDGIIQTANSLIAAGRRRPVSSATITAVCKVLPYRDRLLAGIVITVDIADGQHMEHGIMGDAGSGTIEAILDKFFSRATTGLSAIYRDYWHATYTEYKRRKATE